MKIRAFSSRQSHSCPRTVRKREAVILALASTIAGAGAQIWDSGGANNNWGTGANWSADTAPVNNGNANLIFGSGARTAPNVDVAWNINSLTFQLASSPFTIAGQQLTLQGGGISNNSIALQTVNNNLVLGAPQTWNAVLGNLSIGTNSSSLANGGNTLTVDGANNTTINGSISGTGGIIKNGGGTLTIAGTGNTNTYSGTTTVNSGTLVLNKSAISTDVAVTGNLAIGDGTGTDIVRLDANLQIKDSVTVTVNSSGQLNLNGHNDDFTTLVLNGGSVITGVAGMLTMFGDVTTLANANAASISGNLALGTVRNFHVGSGSAPIDLIVSANITSGGINKDGLGWMKLSGNNTFPLGLTFGGGGTLILSTDTAAGTGTLALNAGNIQSEGGPRTLANAVTLGGDVTFGGTDPLAFTGAATLTGNRTLDFTQPATFSGPMGETGGSRSLTINSFGAVTFNGANNNTFSGTTTVNSGTLNLGKTGSGNYAIHGLLVVGDGNGGANADVVRYQNKDQIIDGGGATINSSGLLDLNGFHQSLGGITFNGGNLTTGAGGEIYFNANSSIAYNASSTPATISGNMTISTLDSVFFNVADGAGAFDMDITANMSGGSYGANKLGFGVLRLAGNNTFAGGLTVKEGALSLGSNTAMGNSTLYMEGSNNFNWVTLMADGAGRTISNTVFFNGSGYVGGTKDLTLSGGVVLGNAAGMTLVVNNTGTTTFSGTVQVNIGNTVTYAGDTPLNLTGYTYVDGTFKHIDGQLNANNMIVRPGGLFDMNTGLFSYPYFNGKLINYGTFRYTDGDFQGHIDNYGTVDLPWGILTAGDGLTNYTDLPIPANNALYLNGQGFDNEATTLLSGGTLAGSGPQVNNGVITGTGTIGGTGGFTNNGLITQGDGPLKLSNTAANYNNGSIILAAGRQLQLSSASLNNRGALALNGALVTGNGTLFNNAAGTIAGPGTILTNFQNNGMLVPQGTLNVANAWPNAGVVQLTGPLSSLTGGAITNSGTIQGNGSVGAAVTNSGGTIEALGGTLVLNGTVQNQAGSTIAASTGNKILVATGLTTNAGFISLTGGTFDNSNRPLTNTGRITGYGTLRTGTLINNSSVTLSGGVTTVSGAVTNNVGGQIHVAYDSFLFTGDVVNNGVFKNTDASVTFAGSYLENGTYISDPADNFFNSLTVGESGALNGGLGDRFIIGGDLVTTSRQSGRWQTGAAEIRFEGGDGSHELGVGGQDFGYSDAGFNNNFSWGIVSVAAGDSLVLVDYDGQGGALYAGVLDLGGGLAQIESIESNGLNLYYHPARPENAWLGGETYLLKGGGQLAPVPEPRALLLLAAGVMIVFRRRRS